MAQTGFPKVLLVLLDTACYPLSCLMLDDVCKGILRLAKSDSACAQMGRKAAIV